MLSHKNQRLSQARMQYCIMCNDCVNDPYLHALMSCRHWSAARAQIYEMTPEPERSNRQAMYNLLCVCPGGACFVPLVSLCVDIDKAANSFWELYV